MSLGRVLYRVRQFFLAMRPAVDPQDFEHAHSVLTPAQMALFTGMQSSEQAHAMSVYRQLVAQGETSPDLLAAALLHDVGKSLSPLRLWDRILIVLARAVFPAQSRRWGSLPRRWMGAGDGGGLSWSLNSTRPGAPGWQPRRALRRGRWR